MGGFIQVIEIQTTKLAEIEEVMAGWKAATEGSRRPSGAL